MVIFNWPKPIILATSYSYIHRRRSFHCSFHENDTEYARMVQNPNVLIRIQNGLELSIMVQNSPNWSKKIPKLNDPGRIRTGQDKKSIMSKTCLK